jgi:uncharacterized protein
VESNVSFCSFDGTPLEGTYRNSAEKSNTVSVLVHGITSSRDEFGLYSGLADFLATKGMPTLRFDYRCHGKSKKPIKSMTLAGIVNDIEAAAKLALTESGASSVNVVGMSFGGGLSAFWAAFTTLQVKRVVMLAPVIDYIEDILGQHDAIVDGNVVPTISQQLANDGFIEMDEICYGAALINELPVISAIDGLRRLKSDSLIVHGDADSAESTVPLGKYCRNRPRFRCEGR